MTSDAEGVAKYQPHPSHRQTCSAELLFGAYSNTLCAGTTCYACITLIGIPQLIATSLRQSCWMNWLQMIGDATDGIGLPIDADGAGFAAFSAPPPPATPSPRLQRQSSSFMPLEAEGDAVEQQRPQLQLLRPVRVLPNRCHVSAFNCATFAAFQLSKNLACYRV